jgi:hypothetical protein
MIVEDIHVFDGKQLRERFALNTFGYSRTLAIGNIISFFGNLNYREGDKFICAEQAINFCIELPKYDTLSGVLFNRLFLLNVAQILSTDYLKHPIDISQNKLIIEKEHENRGIIQKNGILSVNFMSQINDTFMIYLGLYNKCADESEARAFSMGLSTKEGEEFMSVVNESFYFLSNDVFLNTCHVK